MTYVLIYVNNHPEFMLPLGVYFLGFLLVLLSSAALGAGRRDSLLKIGNDLILVGFGFLGTATINSNSVSSSAVSTNPIVDFAVYAFTLLLLYVISMMAYLYVRRVQFPARESLLRRGQWFLAFATCQGAGLLAIAITYDLTLI